MNTSLAECNEAAADEVTERGNVQAVEVARNDFHRDITTVRS